MVQLTLAGLSDDGTRLLLVDDAGREFTLAIDAKLRTAVRGGDPRQIQRRLGQLEIQMDSTLRPRDIQARIRAGASPEDVAEAAQTSVEKIMPFAGPVLAEREHIAMRAQSSSVRRHSDGGARTLGDSVRDRMIELSVPSDSVEWDSFRREDGRWSLTGSFETSARSGVGTFIFDLPGNYVVPDDDDARWLIGDLPVVEPPAPAAEPAAGATDEQEDADDEPDDATRPVRKRRLTAVRSDDQELPLGDDALQLVSPDPEPVMEVEEFFEVEITEEVVASDAADQVDTMDLSETAARIREAGRDPEDDADAPAVAADPEPQPKPEPKRKPRKKAAKKPEAEATEPTEANSEANSEANAETTSEAASEATSDAGAAEPADDSSESDEAPHEPPTRRPVKKTRGRASVPSWDEIMFGGKQD